MQPFPQRLAALMDEKNVSQQALGQAIGVTRQSIAQYLDGNTQPNARKICELADFFGVSTDYLLCRVDYRSPIASVQGICEETGLSSEAVEALMEMRSGAAAKWENPYPYQENDVWFPDWTQRKESVFFLLNLLLDRNELLEDLLILSKHIDEAADTAEHSRASGIDAMHAAENGSCVLSPHEMKEYREYLVANQARKLAYHALAKRVSQKVPNQKDIQGLQWFYKKDAEGGEA